VPDGLDYDLYIGPAPMKPCSKDRITSAGSWYCADYAIGFIAGWGAHPLDIAIWGLDYDQQGPFKIRGTGTVATPDALFNTLTTWDVKMEFAGGIKTAFMSDDIAKPMVEKPTARTGAGTAPLSSAPRAGSASAAAATPPAIPDWFREKQGADAKRVPYQNNYYRGLRRVRARPHAIHRPDRRRGALGRAEPSVRAGHPSPAARWCGIRKLPHPCSGGAQRELSSR
jgi:hypothetical protein